MPGIDGRIDVSVAHWNNVTYGLADMLDEDNFHDFVNKFDICFFLTETWKDRIVNMSGKIVNGKDGANYSSW